ncbi:MULTISPECIES: hypothetical protein [Tenacibaculum]|uniref:hypothetical protein n=1 Tax=Tenacibaculum TaxID=104267 RepID=UPI001F0A605F|nr:MULTISPECIES: hypothetical protein [Tenacibaculum]MCH3881500.1 hypothetical protein [Tenacibaculum aquimarinum]MDO6598905.1 hypothetical protein [Tenacibaculum sp. 1_MG-2023]
MKKGLNKFAKGMFAIFTIKLLFFGMMFLNQSCQTDDNIFSTSEKELALERFENMSKEVLPDLKISLEKMSLSNKSSNSEMNNESIEILINKLNPLVNSSVELLQNYGFTNDELTAEMGTVNDPKLVIIALAILKAETKNNEVSMNIDSFFASSMYAQDTFDCLIRSVGIDAVVDMVKGRISKAAVSKLVRKLAKRALGPIGAAWAAYEFGDCMGWY